MQLDSRAIARYWAKVDRSGEHWLWAGSRHKFGHGHFFPRVGECVAAHRVAWYLATGEDPGADLILHTCDVPGCQRNDDEGTYEVNGLLLPRRGHLFRGSQADNIADRDAKGRQASGFRQGKHTHPESRLTGERHPLHANPELAARGERNGFARLTAEKVVAIRAKFVRGVYGYDKLATEFGVDRSTIADLIVRRTWKHVP